MPLVFDCLLGLLYLLQSLFCRDQPRIGLVEVVDDRDGIAVGDSLQLLEGNHPVVVNALQPGIAALHVV